MIISSQRTPRPTQPEWSVAERTRLLELYMRDLLWDKRAEELESEFGANRPPEFFSIQSAKLELHRIFREANPEHVNTGLPSHPRGKEAAEMWLKYYRKKLTEKQEHAKQMLRIGMRKTLDLVLRFKNGKLPEDELLAIRDRQREQDAERPDAQRFEKSLQRFMSQANVEDLDKVNTLEDLVKVIRGDQIPSKALRSPSAHMLRSPKSIGSPHPVSPGRNISSDIEVLVPKQMPTPKQEQPLDRLGHYSPSAKPFPPNQAIRSPVRSPMGVESEALEQKPMVIRSPTHTVDDGGKPGGESRSPPLRFVQLAPSGQNAIPQQKKMQVDLDSPPSSGLRQRPSSAFSPSQLTPSNVSSSSSTTTTTRKLELMSRKESGGSLSTVPKARHRIHISDDEEEEGNKQMDITKSSPQASLRKALRSPSKKVLVETEDGSDQEFGEIGENQSQSKNVSRDREETESPEPLGRPIKDEALVDECFSHWSLTLERPEETEEVKKKGKKGRRKAAKKNKKINNDEPELMPFGLGNIPAPSLVEKGYWVTREITTNLCFVHLKAIFGESEKVEGKVVEPDYCEVDANFVEVKAKVEKTARKTSKGRRRKRLHKKNKRKREKECSEELISNEIEDSNEGEAPKVGKMTSKRKLRTPSGRDQSTAEDSESSSAQHQKKRIREEISEAVSTEFLDVPPSKNLRRAHGSPALESTPATKQSSSEGSVQQTTTEHHGLEKRRASTRIQPLGEAKPSTLSTKKSEEKIIDVKTEIVEGKEASTTLELGKKELEEEDKNLWHRQKLSKGNYSIATQTNVSVRHQCQPIQPIDLNLKQSRARGQITTKKSQSASSQTGLVEFSSDDVLFIRQIGPTRVHKQPNTKAERREDTHSDEDTIAQIADENEKLAAIESQGTESGLLAPKSGRSRSSRDSSAQSQPPPPLTPSENPLIKVIVSRRKGSSHNKKDGPSRSVGRPPRSQQTQQEVKSPAVTKTILVGLWKEIIAIRHATIFMQPVDKEDVPGYHLAVKKPMDLSTIKRRIESGDIATIGQFSEYIVLMFTNAIMFNSTDHDINQIAKDMLRHCLKLIRDAQYAAGEYGDLSPPPKLGRRSGQAEKAVGRPCSAASSTGTGMQVEERSEASPFVAPPPLPAKLLLSTATASTSQNRPKPGRTSGEEGKKYLVGKRSVDKSGSQRMRHNVKTSSK